MCGKREHENEPFAFLRWSKDCSPSESGAVLKVRATLDVNNDSKIADVPNSFEKNRALVR